MSEEKAVLKMMEQLPPGTPVPRYLLIGDTAYSEATIRHIQEVNRGLYLEISRLKREQQQATEERDKAISDSFRLRLLILRKWNKIKSVLDL